MLKKFFKFQTAWDDFMPIEDAIDVIKSLAPILPTIEARIKVLGHDPASKRERKKLINLPQISGLISALFTVFTYIYTHQLPTWSIVKHEDYDLPIDKKRKLKSLYIEELKCVAIPAMLYALFKDDKYQELVSRLKVFYFKFEQPMGKFYTHKVPIYIRYPDDNRIQFYVAADKKTTEEFIELVKSYGYHLVHNKFFKIVFKSKMKVNEKTLEFKKKNGLL